MRYNQSIRYVIFRCLTALECPANSKYTRCMRQCQPTCSDSDATICRKMSPYLGSYCVEGAVTEYSIAIAYLKFLSHKETVLM